MRQVKVEYKNFERPENQELIAGIITAYDFLFPVWLRTLTVAVYDKHEDEDKWDAWSNGSPEYGTAEIGMMARCLGKPQKYLQEMIVHELIHTAHMRVYELMRNNILATLKESNPKLCAFVEEEMRQRVEEFMENTAVGIVGFVRGPNVIREAAPADPSDARTWRSEKPKRLPTVPKHKPLAMEGHRSHEWEQEPSHD